MAGHSPLLITLIVSNMVAYLVNQIFSLFGNLGEMAGNLPRLYPNTIANISNKQSLEITPSSATFSIWGPIYVWQALWMVYGLVNICRKTSTGPVYTNPIVLTPLFYIVSIVNWAIVVGWTFFWTYEMQWASFVFLFLTALTIYILVGLSYKSLNEHKETLLGQKRCSDLWATRILVQNGLAFYGTWCTIATLLNLAMALTYDVHPRYDQSTSSTISLSILSAELGLYVITDWTILDKYSRYTVSPYIVVIVALAGSITKNWNPAKMNSIFTAILLVFVSVAAICKVIILIFRHVRDVAKEKTITPTTEKSPGGAV